MPEQHREFFPLLPFVIVGSIDAEARPSASALAAPPGFVNPSDEFASREDVAEFSQYGSTGIERDAFLARCMQPGIFANVR
jgi:hypothetical protein